MWIYHQITQKHLFSFWNTITVVRPSLFYCVSMIYYTRIRNTNTLSCWTELGQRWFKTKTCFLKVINKLSPEAEWIFCIPFSRKISYWSMKISSHLKNLWDKCRRWSCLSKDHAHLTSWLLYNPFTQKKGQTYFKILRCEHCQIFKVYLAIFQHYAWKDYLWYTRTMGE